MSQITGTVCDEGTKRGHKWINNDGNTQELGSSGFQNILLGHLLTRKQSGNENDLVS